MIAPLDALLLADIVERASRSSESEQARTLNYKYTTMNQIEGRARKLSASRDAARLKMLNLRRLASRMCRKLQEYKKVMIFLGENDIPGVRRVLGQALKDGKSPIAMLGTLEAAFEGKYRARGHTEDDLDLAILVLRVGGPSLLFSLSQALCLPSVSSVYVEMKKRYVSETGGCRVVVHVWGVFPERGAGRWQGMFDLYNLSQRPLPLVIVHLSLNICVPH